MASQDSGKKWGSGVEFLFLTLPIFHESFLQTLGFFTMKMKKHLRRHPSMKIGQPKLAEGKEMIEWT